MICCRCKKTIERDQWIEIIEGVFIHLWAGECEEPGE
jgi:hypothetical protein